MTCEAPRRSRGSSDDCFKVEMTIDLEKDPKLAMIWQKLCGKASEVELGEVQNWAERKFENHELRIAALEKASEDKPSAALARDVGGVTVTVNQTAAKADEIALRLSKLEATNDADPRVDCMFNALAGYCSDYNEAQGKIETALAGFAAAANIAAAAPFLATICEQLMGLNKTIKKLSACGGKDSCCC